MRASWRPSHSIVALAPLAAVWLALLSVASASPAAEDRYGRFFAEVRPLIVARCIQCHGPEKQEGELRLDSLPAILQGGASGPAVFAGKPAESLLVKLVRREDPDRAMPPKEKLSEAEIDSLTRWVKEGPVWPEPALVLFDEEEPFITALNEGTGRADIERTDRQSGKMALRITPPQKFSARIAGWEFNVRERPAAGEYRYLRFAWKSSAAAMIELANRGAWPDAKEPRGRYVAGANATGWAAIQIAEQPPAEWTVVTRDLWADMGDVVLTGIAPTASAQGPALFDAIVLGPTVESLDAYTPGQGSLTTGEKGEPSRIGDAWSDPRNPIVRLFKGQRLDLWSLKKPTRPPVPAVRDAAWPRNAIDAFILARLESAGIAPSPPADRRTLARRLYFDLIGLPPSPEEIEEFVADERPDSYEQLVERLLASPRYGERWARRWLDVVRYSDTHGFERDEFRPTMWRYRDYVIRALNADKPYDEFLREQIAGDELIEGEPQSSANIDRRLATGYLRLGPFDSTRAVFQEDEVGHDQLMADLVNTTGVAMLGMTMACCQCHDHKYDPLSQADHYRMRAFFAAVKFRDDVVADTTEVCRQIEEHNAAVDKKIAVARAPLDQLLSERKLQFAAERRAKFPPEIQKLLAGDEKKRDDATRAKLKPYLDQLAISDADAVKDLDEPRKKRHDELAAKVAEITKERRSPATCVGVTDVGSSAPVTRVLFQGDYTQPRDETPPGYLSVLDPNAAAIEPPTIGNTTGRRTTFARWITSDDNPLAARVMVNRLWQHHFGRGIAATPNDFGHSGSLPTHPELLDYLAVELRESDWSLKHLHRLIVLSAAYRQASTDDAKRHKLDPDNLLVWRQNIQRLDAETLRDALLAVGARLLPTSSGRPWWPPLPMEILNGSPAIFEEIKGGAGGRLQGWYADPVEATYVRSIFLVQKQSVPVPFLQAFDLPEFSIPCGRRNVTTVAPQALVQLNGELAVAMARSLADRVIREVGENTEKQIELAFHLALARKPTDEERTTLVELVARHRKLHEGQQADQKIDASRAALVDVCRVLLNVNEFLYID